MRNMIKMKVIFGIINLNLIALVLGGNVIFEDCGSAYELDTVNIEGCERQVPCYLVLGEPTNVTVTYQAGFVSTSLTQATYIVLNSVQRDTYVSPNACEATGCPVKIQVSTQYEATLELPTNLAINTRGFLHWSIVNEKTNTVICFTVTVQTKNQYETPEHELDD